MEPAAPTETLLLSRGDDNGRIAYEIHGGGRGGSDGPLVVCVPGMGDLRGEYRFLAQPLVDAGYRVILMDLRGLGESDTTFKEYGPEAVGSDIVALLNQYNQPAFVVGTSFAAAAAVWAAAEAPARVLGVVLVGPFVRDIPVGFALNAALKVMMLSFWARANWVMYYKSLYPSNKPKDFDAYCQRLKANLGEKGRLAALQAQMKASKKECERRIAECVNVPALVLMGTKDPDFSSPEAEAKHVSGLFKRGKHTMVEGAGHYPHAEFPDIAAREIVPFLQSVMTEKDEGIAQIAKKEGEEEASASSGGAQQE